MQHIKQQIYSHIKGSQVKDYLDKNIFNHTTQSASFYFNPNLVTKDSGLMMRNRSSSNDKSSSSMIMSSFFMNNKPQNNATNRLSIKSLLKRIQGLVVMDGFWKNVEEINQMKKNIHALKIENDKMEIKLAQRKIVSINKVPQSSRISYNKSQVLDETSQISKHISFTNQLHEVQEKLQNENTRRSLIQIVRLSKQKKEMLLSNTKRQYESMLRQIQTIQKVIDNIEKLHPDQAGLRIEVELLQEELKEKNMIVEGGQELDKEIERLKRQIDTIQRQNPLIFKQQQSVNNNNKQQIQNQFEQNSQHHIKKYRLLRQQLSDFEQFLKQQQQQKHQLVKQIKSFNQTYEKEKLLNQQLFTKIKSNFYQYPELIDQIININTQDKNKIQFLLKRLELSFQ